MQKSKATSFILCFLFGPLGLFYTFPPLTPIALTLIAIIFSGTIAIPVAIWILSMWLGVVATGGAK